MFLWHSVVVIKIELLNVFSMQDFELYGRAMQLGWGQENRDEKPSNTEHFRETKINQQQYEKVRILQGYQMYIKLKCRVVYQYWWFASKIKFLPIQ